MGDIFSPIQVQLERIERQMEKLCTGIGRMVEQHSKIGRFLIAQEKILTRRTQTLQNGEAL
ncbi:uncharacterized protein Eint_081425 [Encephalitozoon intestinalis ATCC 50506]|uniref:Uncharacterized protein n=1 Tax=Encephalitozoon intestinalis (strain ATCC 50506) TaxID=876142 RepID=W8P934_ENCIT|nr:uncharacterized protein Eint_081425 [Encephalitozoon intestinalis ATCC 50506]AHL30143.1 hypothetical protein Eint_081425 [Encephalitozoon intestinalis ATCC 50506]UTX45866.1 hypothetical protein GPK93_08g14450 [Encephalitozoon intestinalis]